MRPSLAPLVATILLGACQAIPQAEVCHGIPDGGCPGLDQTNCLDPTCSAIYTCEPGGTWTYAAPCPVREAGPDVETIADSATPSRDVATDVPGASGGPGCVDLQPTDCTVEEGLVCGPSCCGCEDLFACQDGGWVLWGICGEGGAMPVDE